MRLFLGIFLVVLASITIPGFEQFLDTHGQYVIGLTVGLILAVLNDIKRAE